MPFQTEELDQSNLPDQSNEQDQTTDQSANESQTTSDQRFSTEHVERAISMSQRIAENAQREAEAARNELAEFRRSQTVQNAPRLNFAELNERATNGQFAEVQADIVAQELDRRLAPLINENKAAARERNIQTFVGQAIEAHMHPDYVRPGKAMLENYVRTQLNGADPSYNVVKMMIDGAVGNVLAANPRALEEFYGQRNNPNPTNAAPTNNNQPQRGGPVPPRIPTGRPSPTNGQSKLDESEKKLKAKLDPSNKMSDDDFLTEFYAPKQSRVYDI